MAPNTLVRLRSYITDTSVDNLSTRTSTIWEAARATSAAATFFDPVKIGRQEYVDGATGANNPVEVVLEEAASIWPSIDMRSGIECLVSIGTGIPELQNFGDDLKAVLKTLKSISTETEATEARFAKSVESRGLAGRYFRFNVDRGLSGVALNEHLKLPIIEAASERYLEGHGVRSLIGAFVAVKPPTINECT